VGVHQDGLVHVSELSHSFIEDPCKAFEVGTRTKVKVVEVDFERRRISLSIKQTIEPPPRPPRPKPEPQPQTARPARPQQAKGGPPPKKDDRRDKGQKPRSTPPKYTPFADLYMENGVVKIRK
jgi:protein Tex